MSKFYESRFRFYILFVAVYLFYNFLIRTSLLVLVYDKIELSLFALNKIYIYGFFYDLVSSFYLAIPVVLYLMFAPKKLYTWRFHKILASIFFITVLFGFGFLAISEQIFWEEFGVRFNFIAVDYLVYTKEVIGNIKESYPIGLILVFNLVIALAVFYPLRKYLFNSIKYDTSLERRGVFTFVTLSLAVISFFTVTSSNLNFENKYEKNLAFNGLYQLFTSFRNNILDYEEFYLSLDKKDVINNYKALVKEPNSSFISPNLENISRTVINTGEEKQKNVIFLVVESLSAEFMGSFGDKRRLTPNLDKLAKESMFFNNFYATGTRTVRGMEALTLSIPPTPGRSVVKRLDNQNMYSAGFVFKEKNYDTSFIYGGHGYFDNMNAFFSQNGFTNIVDRTDMSDDEISFSNVWGVADGDLYNKSLKYFDKKAKEKENFFSFIMTTSNHRPYSYPDGKIDIPSKTGRDGAVKYTDYAIGEFIKKAKTKEWFDDTIFVIVADHNAKSAGKTALPVNKYRIPLIIYSPKNIKVQRVNKISSQIDLIPTVLSLLNWDYKSKFYGKDILDDNFIERALIGTYQKLGLYRNNKLTILSTNKEVIEYEVVSQDLYSSKYKKIEPIKKDVLDTITYYQSASYFYKNKINRVDN